MGNPQVTYFKSIWRRHTNFSMQSNDLTVYGEANFQKRFTVPVPKQGDLLMGLWLEVTMPDLSQYDFYSEDNTKATNVRYVDWLGHALINSVELEAGGNRICKFDKHYLHVSNYLSMPHEKWQGYKEMVMADGTGQTDIFQHPNQRTLYIPLPMYFSKNASSALPIVSIVYHEVRLNIELESALSLLKSDNVNITRIASKSGTSTFSLPGLHVYGEFAFI